MKDNKNTSDSAPEDEVSDILGETLFDDIGWVQEYVATRKAFDYASDMGYETMRDALAEVLCDIEKSVVEKCCVALAAHTNSKGNNIPNELCECLEDAAGCLARCSDSNLYSGRIGRYKGVLKKYNGKLW